MLEEQLSRTMGKSFQYQKNSNEMFALLNEYGSQDFAVSNAMRLERIWDSRKDYGKHKPRTKVYELVQEFKNLINRYTPVIDSEEEDNSADLEIPTD
jgi:uncharacterized protein YaaR (DUF327 family)